MKNVSTLFKNCIKDGSAFYAYAVVTLANGKQLTLTSEKDFMVSGNKCTEQGGNDGFPLGVAVSKTITLTIDNLDERYSGYDFYFARISLYTEADIDFAPLKDYAGDDISDTTGDVILANDPTIERIQEGVFTVLNPVKLSDTIELNAYDDMWKSDRSFTSKLTYPVTARQLLVEVCSACEISLGSATFENEDYIIKNAPENVTGRQVIGYIAQIACGNAVIRNGTLVIKSYDFSALNGITDSTKPSNLSEDAGYHIFKDFTSDPDIDTDNVVITGVSTTIGSGDDEKTVIYGKDTYCIKLTNPLIKGNEKAAVDFIGKKLVNVTIRKISGEFIPNPTVEFMDLACVVDRKDKVYRTFVTTHEFEYLGGSTISCDINSPERQAGEYYSNATEIYQTQKDLVKNKSEWENAVENLQTALANGTGMYTTEVKQPDGSVISYIHDKSTLGESKKIIKVTSEAIAISNDGGETYPYGVFLTGDLIAKILYTIGLNADYINSGSLTIKDKNGNITFQADTATGVVNIKATSFSVEGKSLEEIAREEVENVQDDLDNFKDTVNGSFKDGIISESETKAIEQSMNELDKDNEMLTIWFNSVIDSVSNKKSTGSNLKIKINSKSNSTYLDTIGLYYKKDNKIYQFASGLSTGDLLDTDEEYIIPSTDFFVSFNATKADGKLYGFSIDSIETTNDSVTHSTTSSTKLPAFEIVEAGDPALITTSHPYENMQRIWHYQARTLTKDSLTSKMTAYTNAYTALTNAIRTAISDKKITDAERKDIESKIDRYNVAYADLNSALKQAQKDVATSGTVNAATVLKITEDGLQLRITSDQAESLIEAKADLIRLKADKIAWESKYSSMSEDGNLKCTSAQLEGTLKCGTSSGNWMQMSDNGKLIGGRGSEEYGYIDYAASSYNSATESTDHGIQMKCGCLRISARSIATRSSSDVYLTAYMGATGYLKYISEIHDAGNGSVGWTETTIHVENGLIVSELD